MSRYIKVVDTAKKISEKLNIPLKNLIDILAEVSTADVQEVKHGKWVIGYFHDRVCSRCCHPDNDLSEFPHDYCPNCGARMDGEK